MLIPAKKSQTRNDRVFIPNESLTFLGGEVRSCPSTYVGRFLLIRRTLRKSHRASELPQEQPGRK